MQTPILSRPTGVVSAADLTQPISVMHTAARPATPSATWPESTADSRRPSSGAVRSAVLVVCVVAALVVTGTAAFVVGTRAATSSPATATPPVSVIAPTTAAPTAPAEPGPALVDRSGQPVDPEIATAVTQVYDALDAGDLDPVRRAYSAAGSDDWHTSQPHLRAASERAGVLAALRERPSAQDGYLYAADGYTVQFGQGHRYARPGLLTIDGPWVEEPTAERASVPSIAAAPAVDDGASNGNEESDDAGNTRGCAEGTLAVPTEGHPCQDAGTGRGVDRDGTVGVHGLKPCPYGTTVPSDPDEPTRNASTGEICGY